MAYVIPFFKVLNIPFEANASIKPKKYLFNTLRNIFCVSTFQQLFPDTTIFSDGVYFPTDDVILTRSNMNALIKPKEIFDDVMVLIWNFF